MSEGVRTMAMTYEITGVPALAVRVGRALEQWGSRAAQPLSGDEAVLRYEQLRGYEAAVEARRDALSGVYALLR